MVYGVCVYACRPPPPPPPPPHTHAHNSTGTLHHYMHAVTFLPPALLSLLLALSLLSGGSMSVRFIVRKGTWLWDASALPIPAPPPSAGPRGREIRRPGFQMSTGENVILSGAVVPLSSLSSTTWAKVSRLLVGGGKSLPGVLYSVLVREYQESISYWKLKFYTLRGCAHSTMYVWCLRVNKWNRVSFRGGRGGIRPPLENSKFQF